MTNTERFYEIWRTAYAATYCDLDEDGKRFMAEIMKLSEEGHEELTGMTPFEVIAKQTTLEV